MQPTPSQRSGFTTTFAWHAVMAVAVLAVFASAVRWAIQHPTGSFYDEALYFAVAHDDHHRFTERGIKTLLAGLLYDDHVRPPAFRFLVIPYTMAFGVEPPAVRIVSYVWFALSLALLYAGVRRVSRSAGAGALAVTLLVLCPQVVENVIRYGTEMPTYLATAATLYFVLRDWDNPRPRTSSWIGLGLSLALGALSKTTFAAIGGPILLLAAGMSLLKLVRGPGLMFYVKAAALGGIIALPWWLKNWQWALEFATYSMGYERHSLGDPSLAVHAKYLYAVMRGMGLSVAAIVLAALLVSVVSGRWRRPIDPQAEADVDETADRRGRRMAIWLLVLTPIPLIASQMLAANHGVRLVSPIFYAIVAAGAVAAGTSGLLRRPVPTAALAALLVWQLVALIAPQALTPLTDRAPKLALTRQPAFRPLAQWDYEPLVALCRERGLTKPAIAELGNSNMLNIAQLRLAWARHGTRIESTRLWRWERGKISLDKVVADARKHDVVLTVLNGMQFDAFNQEQRDNAHNAAFAARLRSDPSFGEPVRLQMTGREPVEMLVFFNQNKSRP